MSIIYGLADPETLETGRVIAEKAQIRGLGCDLLRAKGYLPSRERKNREAR